jgi:uncharacterized protein (TIGR02449 family)
MNAELDALEEKLTHFVQFCQQLREDNKRLRQQLASALNDNKQLNAKITTTVSRLETILHQIPEKEE